MNRTELNQLRRELAKASELWQFQLLKSQELQKYARDRNVSISGVETINQLWGVGLLRADLILVSEKIDIPFITLVAQEGDYYIYCDERKVPHLENGYGGAFADCPEKFDNIELYFHPFRIYVLYHVVRGFESHTSTTQYLNDVNGLLRLAGRQVEQLDHWTSSEQCSELFEHWNQIAELSSLLDPISYGRVFQSVRWSYPDTQESITEKRVNWRNRLEVFLRGIPSEEINDLRQELCRKAQLIDDNKMVHVLMRLMSNHERLKLKSSLGAAMLFNAMSEIIRRAVENMMGQFLPEEDEIGFGEWMDGARKRLYGTERILDASPQVRRDFLTSMGVDSGVKVRCYLEGETEMGAMIYALGDGARVEFINLKGQFLEKRGKGLNFLGSLKNDLKAHIFSIVMLDADNDDNVRGIRKAAKDEAFFGRFFVASPDFEFGNFTLDELVDVAIGMEGPEKEMPTKNDVISRMQDVATGKDFFRGLKDLGLDEVCKGEEWGAALMEYAIQHQEFPPGHSRAGEVRPLFDAARVADYCQRAGYKRSLDNYIVDPETGDLVKRD